MKPLVSIIIVNWNGGEVFKDCLESLAKIDYPRWELIVVDNGSTDGSENLPQNYELGRNYELVKNKSNLGFAKANNQGYRRAKGKYILLLNNDTRLEPDFLSKLVDRMERDEIIGIVQPKIYNMRKPGYLDNAGSFLTRIGFLQHWGFLEKDGPEFSKEREIFTAKGACMLIRRSVIKKIGLFDEDFVSYFEETDFCWRAWLAGYKILFYPKAKIHHKVGFTIRRLDVANINYHYYKNRIASLLKNLETRSLPLFLIPHLIVSAGIATAFLLRLKPRNSLMIGKAFEWNFLNLGKTLQKRRRVQKKRKVSDKELFEKLLFPVRWRRFFEDFKRVEGDIER